MATKPSEIATWESTKSNESTSTSGHQSTGWNTSDIPAAQEVNYLFRVAGNWQQYLSDGIFSGDVELADNLKVDGTTELAGDATCDATLKVTGALYELTARSAAIAPNLGHSSGVTTTSYTLNSSGAWTWDSPLVGATGDLLTGIVAAAAAAGSAGSVSWSVTALNIDPGTGSITNSTLASGTWTITGGVDQRLTASMPSESGSYEPLDANTSYWIHLSGSTAGILLQGGIRYTWTRPAAV